MASLEQLKTSLEYYGYRVDILDSDPEQWKQYPLYEQLPPRKAEESGPRLVIKAGEDYFAVIDPTRLLKGLTSVTLARYVYDTVHRFSGGLQYKRCKTCQEALLYYDRYPAPGINIPEPIMKYYVLKTICQADTQAVTVCPGCNQTLTPENVSPIQDVQGIVKRMLQT